MKNIVLVLLISLTVFAICFLLALNIGRAFVYTVPGLQPVVLLFSVLIALAMTARVFAEIKRSGRK